MSDRLTSAREVEIRERVEAATKGPWGVERDTPTLSRLVVSEDRTLVLDFGYVGNRTQDDAEFVAHAREDVPALLAELAAVRKERDEAKERLGRICGWNPAQATTDCDWDRDCPVHGEVAR